MPRPANLDGSTRLVTIFGWPLSYTLSPRFQNAALKAAGMNAVYAALPAPDEASFLALARGLQQSPQFIGANITNPYKQAALKLAARLSPAARAIGAVNTLRRGAQGWEGHNTDAPGFLQAVKGAGLNLRGRRVLVLGAGGAARALVWASAEAGALKVTVLARRPQQARDCARLAGRKGSAAALTLEQVRAWGGEADLVVNTLPGDALGAIWGRALPRRRGLAMDISYVPAKTGFLIQASKSNWKCVNGLPMLLAQGALAFELWFKKKPALSHMKRALRQI